MNFKPNMVSRSKRFVYVSESSSDFDVPDSSSTVTNENHCGRSERSKNFHASNRNEHTMSSGRVMRKPKCFSRNALLARENRIKKKIYISNLETEVRSLRENNKELNKSVRNQSLLINDLKKEVKYLKSVLANSTDLSSLMRNIKQNTGMSVTTSLNSTLSLNNCISKPPTLPVAKKTPHPFDEIEPLIEPSLIWSPNLLDDTDDIGNMITNDISLDAMFSFELSEQENCPSVSSSDHWSTKSEIPNEHNYTCISKEINNDFSDENNEDVGVCLHVSKHRVSLEFCSTCCDKANQAWSK